uniref:Uncharacterized protein n=1 Tax=viral metagenome TaxID=1070528 RepID=A0A6M3ITN8_9ZZZZ
MAKYVMMEVVEVKNYSDGRTRRYMPLDAITGEALYLRPDRILEGTWRWGDPKKGNLYISIREGKLSVVRACDDLFCVFAILDPPAVEAPPVPEWEKKMRETFFKNGWSAKDTQDFMDALYEARHQWRKGNEGEGE